jgi:branched-chain amino acid transport system substrate-binding protein
MSSNRKLRSLCTVAVLSLAAAALSGCAGSAQPSSSSDSVVKIGMITPLTGNASPLGTEGRKGAEQAISEINAKGGAQGHKLELVVKDDATDPQQGLIAYGALRDANVSAIIGSAFTNVALGVMPLAAKDKIPYVGTAASDEQVEPVNPYVFMTPLRTTDISTQLLKYFKAKGYTKVAVAIDTTYAFALSGWNAMSAQAAKYGIDFVVKEEFERSATDFSAVLQHVRDSHADALMVWASSPQAVIITKQFHNAGLTMPLVMSGGSSTPQYTEPAGEAAEGAIVQTSLGAVGPYLPAGPVHDRIKQMTDRFEKDNGYFPSQFSFDAYNAVYLIANAVEKKGTSPAEIRDGLENLTITLTEGTYHYSKTDHNGLNADDAAITRIENGKFVPTDWTKRQWAENPPK